MTLPEEKEEDLIKQGEEEISLRAIVKSIGSLKVGVEQAKRFHYLNKFNGGNNESYRLYRN